MSRFSPTDAAFSGFAFIRREWPTVVAWAGVRIAVAIVMMGAVALLAAEDLAQLAAIVLGGPEQLADPTALPDLLMRLGPIPLVIWVIGVVFEATLVAAFYRAYLHPEARRFAFLRLGRAELAVLGASLLWQLAYFVSIFLVTFLALMADVLPAILALVVGLTVVFGYLAGLVWVVVRSSLILVDSFERRRVSPLHSFELTRGHFWPLAGAYVMGFAIVVVLSIAALALFMIIAAVAALAFGQDLGSVGRVFNPDSGVLALTFSAALVVYILYSAITGACSYPLVLGPTAEAYLAFKAQGEAKPEPEPEPEPAPVVSEQGEAAAPAGTAGSD